MKFSNALILSAALVISKASACIPDCWAEKLGFPCCTGNAPEVEFTDENGNWGIENNNWCGILVYDHNLRCAPTEPEPEPEKKEEPVKQEKIRDCSFYNCISITSIGEDGTLYGNSEFGKCRMDLEDRTCKVRVEKYSKAALLGYDICKEQHNDLLQDEDGYWAMENGKWCGIQKCPRCEYDSIDEYGLLWGTDGINGNKCLLDDGDCAYTVLTKCRSAKLGYPCCKETKDVVSVDETGFWGIENGKWCGINNPFPCSYYEEKGYQCCDSIRVNYNNLNITAEGIFTETDGRLCGVYN